MSTTSRARQVIIDTLPSCKGHPFDEVADLILHALLAKRLTVVTLRASTDLFVRFHAHARYLGSQTGDGYEGIYNEAIAYAESQGDWPIKVLTRTVKIDGQDITVDVAVPESTTRANNRQLLTAYEYVTMAAEEHGIVLPEGEEI